MQVELRTAQQIAEHFVEQCGGYVGVRAYPDTESAPLLDSTTHTAARQLAWMMRTTIRGAIREDRKRGEALRRRIKRRNRRGGKRRR